MRIFKYALIIDDSQKLLLPKGAKILCVQVQAENIYLWAMVDPAAEMEPRTFRIAGTGHELHNHERLSFLSTVQMMGGRLVWHVFEEVK